MSEDVKEKASKCSCPYCDDEVSQAEAHFCTPCSVTLRHCARCGTVVEKEAQVCPKCGGKLE